MLATRYRLPASFLRRYRLLRRRQQTFHDFVDLDAFGLRPVVEENAVTQRRDREGLDVLDRDVRPATEQRACFGPENEELRGTRARTPADPLVDEVGRVRLVGPRGRG